MIDLEPMQAEEYCPALRTQFLWDADETCAHSRAASTTSKHKDSNRIGKSFRNLQRAVRA